MAYQTMHMVYSTVGIVVPKVIRACAYMFFVRRRLLRIIDIMIMIMACFTLVTTFCVNMISDLS